MLSPGGNLEKTTCPGPPSKAGNPPSIPLHAEEGALSLIEGLESAGGVAQDTGAEIELALHDFDHLYRIAGQAHHGQPVVILNIAGGQTKKRIRRGRSADEGLPGRAGGTAHRAGSKSGARIGFTAEIDDEDAGFHYPPPGIRACSNTHRHPGRDLSRLNGKIDPGAGDPGRRVGQRQRIPSLIPFADTVELVGGAAVPDAPRLDQSRARALVMTAGTLPASLPRTPWSRSTSAT